MQTKKERKIEFAALIGLDWSEEKHDVKLCDVEGGKRIEAYKILNTPEALEEWILKLKERFNGKKVGVCFEYNKGLLLNKLLMYDFIVLYPINPAMSAKYREAFFPGKAKDDPVDAELMLELLMHHRERLSELRRESQGIKALNKIIKKYDKAIDKIYSMFEEKKIFDSFLGSGEVLGPRLLSAFGTDREKYTSAADFQNYSGISPVTERSGKKEKIHQRYQCPKFIKQTFYEYAKHSIERSVWAKNFYKQKKKEGKSYNTIVRALAYKWQRIMYKCWKDFTLYDEDKYIEQLQKKGSPYAPQKAA